MGKNLYKKIIASIVVISMLKPITSFAIDYTSQVSDGNSHKLTPYLRYDSEVRSDFGQTLEDIAFNSESNSIFAVNRMTNNIDVISIEGGESNFIRSTDVKKNLEEIIKDTPYKDFKFGSLTSIDISKELKYIAVAVEDVNYNNNGLVLFLDYTGKIKRIEWAGKQPKMLTFSPNGKYLLVANEGKAREGYEGVAQDPRGSITVVRMYDERIKGSLEFNELIYPKKAEEASDSQSKGGLNVSNSKGGLNVSNSKGGLNVSNTVNTLNINSSNTVGMINKTNTLPTLSAQSLNLTVKLPEAKKNMATNVIFTGYDFIRDDLVKRGVIIKKDTYPSEDFEPESITIDKNSKYAYITLQENNAILKMDIEKQSFDGIFPLGFKDHNVKGNEIDLHDDDKIDIKNENVFGTYMPDQISNFEYNGETYLVTANEGEIRNIGDYSNALVKDGVTYINTDDYDGYDANKNYIFGARSFSIWKIVSGNLYLVFDSGSGFEKSTSSPGVLIDHFNVGSNNLDFDSTSPVKGVEPESIAIGEVDGKIFAFIGLEKSSGIYTYNITDPYNVYFESYINTRDFSESILGDVSPEDIVFIPSDLSSNGKPLVVASHDVSGTIATYEFK